MKIPIESLIPPNDFIIIGGTGDLSLRKILPALFYRFSDKQIPDGCGLIVAARRKPKIEHFETQLRVFCEGAIKNSGEGIWKKFFSRISLSEKTDGKSLEKFSMFKNWF